jgi:hypothetical protein
MKCVNSTQNLFTNYLIIIMSLLNLLIVLTVVGILLRVFNNYIPFQAPIKNILNTLILFGIIIWLLGIFGIIDHIENIHIG